VAEVEGLTVTVVVTVAVGTGALAVAVGVAVFVAVAVAVTVWVAAVGVAVVVSVRVGPRWCQFDFEAFAPLGVRTLPPTTRTTVRKLATVAAAVSPARTWARCEPSR